MISLLLKAFICTGAIFLSYAVSPLISYTSALQIVYTGLFFAVIAYISDLLLLKRLGSEYTAIIETLVAFLVVYLSQFALSGVFTTVAGAVLTSLFMGISEYLAHKSLDLRNFEENKEFA